VTLPDVERFARAELLRYAVMLTGDRELAQDLVQDVLVKAHGQWDRVGVVRRARPCAWTPSCRGDP
jgi:DNA-directed RNA polymerase specialized sigma24 family protein